MYVALVSKFQLIFYFVALPYPDFITWPNYQEVPLHSTAIIYCNSASIALWKFKGEWIGANKTLLLHSVQWSDDGTYLCKGRHESGIYFTSKATVNIISQHSQVHRKLTKATSINFFVLGTQIGKRFVYR